MFSVSPIHWYHFQANLIGETVPLNQYVAPNDLTDHKNASSEMREDRITVHNTKTRKVDCRVELYCTPD